VIYVLFCSSIIFFMLLCVYIEITILPLIGSTTRVTIFHWPTDPKNLVFGYIGGNFSVFHIFRCFWNMWILRVLQKPAPDCMGENLVETK
jgi:hypothetical protein